MRLRQGWSFSKPAALLATLGMAAMSKAEVLHWMCCCPLPQASCRTHRQPASAFLASVGMTVCMAMYWPNSLPLALGPPGRGHCPISASGFSL